jgi:CRISPR type I-D-associated protein Csc2
MILETLKPYLTDLDNLQVTVKDDGKSYVQPALRQLGAVTIVLVREIVAPTVFKNSDEEITDIDVLTSTGATQVVRAVPNKFKHRERARGLQILRAMNSGGRFPQNKSTAPKGTPIRDVFDMNSFVFGDSVHIDKTILPVKAAVLYGDGISTTEYVNSVSKTFHNRASEDGTLFDALTKKNSTSIFDRHFILPGTLLVQTICTVGRVMTPETLDHLFLSIGKGGVYGGQTSISGVNVRTHVAGIYASKVERAETSPFLIAADLIETSCQRSVRDTVGRVHEMLAPLHAASVTADEADAYISHLTSRLEASDPALAKQYSEAADKVADLFESWFVGKAS